jgi:hypothetical protein
MENMENMENMEKTVKSMAMLQKAARGKAGAKLSSPV